MYFVAIKMIKIAGKTVIMKGKTVHVLFMCLFEHMYIFVSMTAIKNAVMSKKMYASRGLPTLRGLF